MDNKLIIGREGKMSTSTGQGGWTFCFKIGQAVALGITGLVLSLSGYMAWAAQAESAQFGIRQLLGPIPA